MRRIESVWPEAEEAARELARALERGAPAEIVRALDERFTRVDRAFRVAVRRARGEAPRS